MSTVRTILLAVLAAPGCASPPDTNACESIVTIPCEQGRLDATGAWVVGEWTTPRIRYNGLTTYAVCHRLGRVPTHIVLWASFGPEGALAQQIGNVAQVIPRCPRSDGTVAVTDANTVLLRNSGAQDFYVRIVIE